MSLLQHPLKALDQVEWFLNNGEDEKFPGAILFWTATHIDWFPSALSFAAFPGTMISFALIHSSQGALGNVALIAGREFKRGHSTYSVPRALPRFKTW